MGSEGIKGMNALKEPGTNNRETYERMTKAITFMRENYLHQPNLETVAQHVHLSEYHFQRLFTRWAGISPKRFLQYLTVEEAKSKIAETENLLNLTMAVGLSSPGRLHDLFVRLEAMSPGEFKAKAAGLKIWYGIHETPFGNCLIATTTRGICNLQFLENCEQETAAKILDATWKKAKMIYDPVATKEMSHRIFSPVTAQDSPFLLSVKGTNFQIQVWRALLSIPFGEVTTYKRLAEVMGCPTAARAVGNAIGSNPIGYLIPCHRVIRESGELGGYRWGIERKIALLGWEASQN